jgi:flagella basal body P-ring formation protein FlgA
MRCWRRSTTWHVEAAAALAAVLLGAASTALAQGQAAPAPAPDTHARVEAAIVSAVRSRMGPDAQVEVSGLTVRGLAGIAGTDPVVAVLPPGVRLGDPMRVALRVLRGRGRAVRVGEAECVVRVRVPHLRPTRPIARGTTIEEGDVTVEHADVGRLWIQPLPREAAASQALRDLAPGEPITAGDLLQPPAVRTGDPVVVVLRAGPLTVSAEAVAAGNARLGDEIRVVNPASGRTLRGRLVGPRQVEVSHGS